MKKRNQRRKKEKKGHGKLRKKERKEGGKGKEEKEKSREKGTKFGRRKKDGLLPESAYFEM